MVVFLHIIALGGAGKVGVLQAHTGGDAVAQGHIGISVPVLRKGGHSQQHQHGGCQQQADNTFFIMNLLIWQTQKKLLFQSLQDLTCQIFVAAGGGVGVVGHQGVGGRGKSHVVLLGQLLHRAVQGAEVLDKGVGRSRQQGNGIVVAHQNDLGVGVQGLQLLEQGLKGWPG